MQLTLCIKSDVCVVFRVARPTVYFSVCPVNVLDKGELL